MYLLYLLLLVPTFSKMYLFVPIFLHFPHFSHFPHFPHIPHFPHFPHFHHFLISLISLNSLISLISLMYPTFANVYLCPNVLQFYKFIFVPQCAPLPLQMYICDPMCPTFTNVYACPNVPIYAPLLKICIWTSPNYPRGVERQVTSELVTPKLVIQD